MRMFPRFSGLAGLLATSAFTFGQTYASSDSYKKLEISHLQEARRAAKSPAEKVAVTDAWLKAHPQGTVTSPPEAGTFQARMAPLRARPVVQKPLSEKGQLTEDLREARNATLAQARNPREAVALTEEFRRVNADALRERLARGFAGKGNGATAALAERPRATGKDALRAEIATVLRETRAEARTPAEKVALTDEFLRLNAAALAEAQPANRKSPSPR